MIQLLNRLKQSREGWLKIVNRCSWFLEIIQYPDCIRGIWSLCQFCKWGHTHTHHARTHTRPPSCKFLHAAFLYFRHNHEDYNM